MAKLSELIEIAHPEHPKCAVILLLDVSASMSGEKISELNEGVNEFCRNIRDHDLARKRLDLAVLTFGNRVKLAQEFIDVENFEPASYAAEGQTPMGEAVLTAIAMIEKRKSEYKNNGTDYFRPYVFLITDGEPTDMKPGDERWGKVVQELAWGESNKKFSFFSIGVDSADMEVLKQLSPERPPMKLKGVNFREFFNWLSNSMIKVSQSKPGDMIQLPPADGWGMVQT